MSTKTESALTRGTNTAITRAAITNPFSPYRVVAEANPMYVLNFIASINTDAKEGPFP